MAYLLQETQAGRIRVIQKYQSSRYGSKGKRRGEWQRPTPQAVERANERRALEKLWLLLNANFAEGDLFVLLTYRKENRPDGDTAKEQLAKFLRKARALYRREGKELKYIWVTEYKNAAIHHHLVMNRIDPTLLAPLWPHGMVRTESLYEDGQFRGLAEYLIKETSKTFREAGGKRWNPSKNLTRPKESRQVVSAGSWRKEPKIPKGYRLWGEVESGVSQITGWPYQRYVLLALPPAKFGASRKRAAAPKRE